MSKRDKNLGGRSGGGGAPVRQPSKTGRHTSLEIASVASSPRASKVTTSSVSSPPSNSTSPSSAAASTIALLAQSQPSPNVSSPTPSSAAESSPRSSSPVPPKPASPAPQAPTSPSAADKKNAAAAAAAANRTPYKCNRCGQPKRGHVCTVQMTPPNAYGGVINPPRTLDATAMINASQLRASAASLGLTTTPAGALGSGSFYSNLFAMTITQLEMMKNALNTAEPSKWRRLNEVLARISQEIVNLKRDQMEVALAFADAKPSSTGNALFDMADAAESLSQRTESEVQEGGDSDTEVVKQESSSKRQRSSVSGASESPAPNAKQTTPKRQRSRSPEPRPDTPEAAMAAPRPPVRGLSRQDSTLLPPLEKLDADNLLSSPPSSSNLFPQSQEEAWHEPSISQRSFSQLSDVEAPETTGTPCFD